MDILLHLLQNRFVKPILRRYIGNYLENGSSLESERSIKIPHFHRINTEKKPNSLEQILLETQDDFTFGIPLVVADENTWKIYGERVYNTLCKIGTKPSKLIYTEHYLTEAVIEAYSKQMPETDFIFAVGGGTGLDFGKALAYKRCGLANIPTALTNDGIASSISSIRTEHGRVSKQMKYPNAIICDYSILKASPNIHAGIGDAIAKYTSSEDWKLAHKKGFDVGYSETFYQMLNFSALSLMEGVAAIGKECLTNEQYIDLLLGSFMLSAAAMSNAKGKTYPSSGSEHSLSHAVDYKFNKRKKNYLHGEQCGVFTIVVAKLQGKDWKKPKYALKAIGAPTTLKRIGIQPTEENFRIIYDNSKRHDRYGIINETPYEGFVDVLKETGVA